MLNPFAGKTLEELEVIRKAKSDTSERYINDIAMIDKEIVIKKAIRNYHGIPSDEAEEQIRMLIKAGEIDYISKKSLAETIQTAWNYEAQVYDSESNLIFNGWLDDEEQNELLESYGLMVVELGDYRYLKNIETGKVYVDDWQKQPEG